MNALRIQQLALALALAMMFAFTQTIQAQVNEQIWTGAAGVPLDWNGSTWTPVASPPDVDFNEVAVINNGGSAFLDSAASTDAGALTLGRFDDPSGGDGTLEIRSGGSLSLVGNGVTSGNLVLGTGLGGGFTGTLIVQPGGSLTSGFTAITAGGDSSGTFGGTGPGTSTFTTGRLNLDNDLRIIGPNVDFNLDSLTLFGNATINAEITGSAHSAINVSGTTLLGGSVNLDFNGLTPAVGDSWTLINSGGFNRDFTSRVVTTNASLGAGEAFVLSNSGSQIDVSLERVLTLSVDRNTGAVSIDNNSSTSLGFDSYSIRSDAGSLNSGSWQSLSSGPFPDFQEANPSSNQLGEINPVGTATFASSSSQSLGNGFSQATTPFGTPLSSDIEFSYRRDSDGKMIDGIVEYVGDLLANNLVLSIDPASGNAVVTNDSDSSLDIDSYTIASTSSSLLTSWNSLEDQAETGWVEASPADDRLSELNPTGALALGPGQSFTLDGLWSTGGVQDISDLQFQFRDTTLGTFDGIIEFAGSSSADADGDGDVDGADFLRLQRENPSSIADWQAQYPVGGLSSSVAVVPEPISSALLAVGITVLTCQRRIRR